MSAETLRRAATAIREEWGEDYGSAWNKVATYHLVMADWLESVAGAMTPPGEGVVDAGREIHLRDEMHALDVARAYLGVGAS